MNRKWVQKICLVFLCLLGTAVLQVEAAIITVDDNGAGNFSSIQEAVDNAQDGDTILVNPGIYRENVEVYRELAIVAGFSLAGDEQNRTYVIGDVPEYNVFSVSASNVTIDGFHITGGPSGMEWYEVGIYLDGAENCFLKNNTLVLNDMGIGLNNSRGNYVENNLVALGSYGIVLLNSEENTILKNQVLIHGQGIALQDSVNNMIYANIFYNSHNAVDEGFNIWNNSVGNLWGDYSGEDANGDGIGDLPYSINESTGSIDYKPIVPQPSSGDSENMSSTSGVEVSLANKVDKKDKKNQLPVEDVEYFKEKNVLFIFKDNRFL